MSYAGKNKNFVYISERSPGVITAIIIAADNENAIKGIKKLVSIKRVAAGFY